MRRMVGAKPLVFLVVIIGGMGCSGSSLSMRGGADSGPVGPVALDAATDGGGADAAPAPAAADAARVILVDGPGGELPGPDAGAADAAAEVGRAGPGAMVYVGGFRAEIDVLRLDPSSLQLTRVGTVATPPMQPSFFAWHPSGRYAYSVDEVDDGKVVSYTVDQTSGLLVRLNDAPVMGFGPTYIALDKTGKWALTASWAGAMPASIAVNPIGDDGKVGPPADRRMFPAGAHAHFITTDPTNRFVFASINGEDYVAQYRFDVTTGKLTENTPPRVMRAGGPRHMAFHPGGKFAYLINEQGNTVTVYSFDDASGTLTQIQDIPTLPPNAPASSTAHILVHPSGKFVYGSNRGHDSIVIYSVDPTTGKLTLVGFQTGVGAFPRNFSIDSTGTLLLVVGEHDGMLNVFKIDQTAGTLSRAGTPTPVGREPTYVTLVR
jgi:6-phosphogluconolactonase